MATVLVGIALLSSSCKREAVKEPSPFGPSTLSILLNLTASPNVIFAGSSREMTTVTATLRRFDGAPLAGKTVYFQVESKGGQQNVGFFEVNQAVASRTTNSSGMASINYYGPLALELTKSVVVNIRASVAWEGSEFIEELTPVQIVRNPTELTFLVGAVPNVLNATATRPQAMVTARVLFGATPAKNRRVYFSILNGPGQFSDGKRKTFALTDDNGMAVVTYIGPTASEIPYDLFVEVSGHLETTSFEVYTHKEIFIRIIKGE